MDARQKRSIRDHTVTDRVASRVVELIDARKLLSGCSSLLLTPIIFPAALIESSDVLDMSLSAHLVEQYDTLQLPQAPFGEPVHSSQLSISGPMSFAPHMHGTFMSQPFTDTSMDQSMVSLDAPSMMSITTASAQKIAKLQATLDKKLGPEYISQRPGPGGGPKLTYAEGWKIINLANEIFGFNGWSSSVKSMMTDFVDYNQETKRYSVGVTAIIRVTLRDGAWHEDVGYGMLENGKSKGAALDKVRFAIP